MLPIPEPVAPAFTELDARNAKAPPRFEVRAPSGAPNVVIVLLDDIGFGQSSAFGGWTLYMKEGRVLHEYNFFGAERTRISGPAAASAGKHDQVRVRERRLQARLRRQVRPLRGRAERRRRPPPENPAEGGGT